MGSTVEEAFRSISMDAVSTKMQMTDIRLYMNYHLNFHRLFSEDRPVKIEQQFKNLTALSDVISPQHGFALYFLGFLRYKLYESIQPDVRERLAAKLDESKYWSERFEAFGLSVEDLQTTNFKNKDFRDCSQGSCPGTIVATKIWLPTFDDNLPSRN